MGTENLTEDLMKIVDLQTYFNVGKHSRLHAVDKVNLTIKKGTTLGIVGESGCGKSTLGRTVLGLQPATGGSIFYKGEDITKAGVRRLKELRKDLQIIFQDPYSSINPRHSIRKTIMEPMIVNKMYKSKAECDVKVRELMDTVGLAERFVDSYPHELDGGRRQRVGIARALAVEPEFIVCDEPVSALDVSIQAQILNLLMDLQEEKGLTYMFITHNLSVVKHISDEIAVMYLGQCVEKAPAKELFASPLHPYTKALIAAIPVATYEAHFREPELIKGEITSPIDPKPGCRFASRCPYCKEQCLGQDIPMTDMGDGHTVACVLYQ